MRIDGLAIGAAATVRDPHAGARAHDRLERGHEPARRVKHAHAVAHLRVDVRLAVGEDDDALALQVLRERSAAGARRSTGLLALLPRFRGPAAAPSERTSRRSGWNSLSDA